MYIGRKKSIYVYVKQRVRFQMKRTVVVNAKLISCLYKLCIMILRKFPRIVLYINCYRTQNQKQTRSHKKIEHKTNRKPIPI